MKIKKIFGSFFIMLVLVSCAKNPTGDGNKIRVGYFPNLTHAQVLIGMANGAFAQELGKVKIENKLFNAGPSAVEALFAGELDLAYMGPGPAINAFARSGGEFVIVSGAALGGAGLVVQKNSNINSNFWRGKKIATPQLGNTQDISARTWVKSIGMKTLEEGGNVAIFPLPNAQQFSLFSRGEIDAVWSVEPWLSRLQIQLGAQLVFLENEIWKDVSGGKFASTVIVVRKSYLQKNPQIVRQWLKVHVELTRWIQNNPQQAKDQFNVEFEKFRGKKLKTKILDSAFKNVEFTCDPVEKVLLLQAKASEKLGFLGRKNIDFSGLLDLSILKQLTEI